MTETETVTYDISIITTIYNKEAALPTTVASILAQHHPMLKIEYIFVDDCSTDQSVAVLKQLTASYDHVRIITNDLNQGPSVRVNQGIQAATGQYIQLVDGDDIVPQGTSCWMYEQLQSHQADLFYGKHQKRLESRQDLLAEHINKQDIIRISDNPLDQVLKGGYICMTFMASRELLMRTGGADERVFVQDESLPIRMSLEAKRLLTYEGIVSIHPFGDQAVEHISSHQFQTKLDRFLSYYYFLHDHKNRLSQKQKDKVYAKCISTAWKTFSQRSWNFIVHPLFWQYLHSKTCFNSYNPVLLEQLRQRFDNLPSVRRMPAGSNHSSLVAKAEVQTAIHPELASS